MAFERRGFFKTDKLLKSKIFITVIFLSLFNAFNLSAITFKVASYNVENLFDLQYDGREYPEYIPYTGFKWDNSTYYKKLENIAKVLCDLDAHIIGLQEIESEMALKDLIATIKNRNCKYYKYYTIVKDKKEIPVRTALISVFPIVKKREIKLSGDFRDILQAKIDIGGKKLTIFVNHWKSKRWPEKHRIVFAERLIKEIGKLKTYDDYIILGDFNSNYNEFKAIKYNYKQNNTKGLTGINHILTTVSNNQLIDKFTILKNKGIRYHYNLWLEIDKFERFSYIFRNRRETPDGIIISQGLFDDLNISYVDCSFEVFKPPYLFNNNKINRWQRAKSGKAWHIGKGYSDHLPIYASFTNEPFKIKDDYPSTLFKKISNLYDDYKGKAIIKNAAIIYQHKNNCIIKSLNDRAIYCYNCLDSPKLFNVYDLLIHRIKKYKGLTEITSANIINIKGKIRDTEKFYIECNENTNYINNINEICSELEGMYKDEYLYFGKQKIRLFMPKNIKIENNKKISLQKVRIGFLKEPAIFVDEFSQLKNEYKH